MRAWRVARAPFADLTGEGARLYGGRWNLPGRAMVYTAENPALAILEVRVHLDLEPDLVPDDYVLIEMEFGDAPAAAVEQAPADPAAFGDAWLIRAEEAVLKVPSFIAPQSFNYLVNPAHLGAATISIVSRQPFSFDRRLWLPLTS
ncbi:RES family NAD+ phosphorylase [Bosea sp. (in: a-proteobacteria)]|jgi:RES domain-containing protein|uniref:RES family NAD+ phosphorylase n=1 Tax=Bosea sp. (in: a-proteobacteria) TaxID=1871050 RepID=UPI002DDCC73F|nr:RES family NAD+ phosphorylase [Bosea sp. (in: a-proteobacteria)]HEV2509316.1 RES family NAD+ phosphorylase [Bosea sp. (in: a-proteobacteria)]